MEAACFLKRNVEAACFLKRNVETACFLKRKVEATTFWQNSKNSNFPQKFVQFRGGQIWPKVVHKKLKTDIYISDGKKKKSHEKLKVCCNSMYNKIKN